MFSQASVRSQGGYPSQVKPGGVPKPGPAGGYPSQGGSPAGGVLQLGHPPPEKKSFF